MIYRGRVINEKLYKIIDSHVQDIPKRIQEIDPGYFIVLNRRTGKFEVHHIKNRPTTYAFTVTADTLDTRVLDETKSTRIEYAEKILREMHENNEKIKEKKREEFKDYVGQVARDIYQYAAQSHKSRECRLNRKVAHG